MIVRFLIEKKFYFFVSTHLLLLLVVVQIYVPFSGDGIRDSSVRF